MIVSLVRKTTQYSLSTHFPFCCLSPFYSTFFDCALRNEIIYHQNNEKTNRLTDWYKLPFWIKATCLQTSTPIVQKWTQVEGFRKLLNNNAPCVGNQWDYSDLFSDHIRSAKNLRIKRNHNVLCVQTFGYLDCCAYARQNIYRSIFDQEEERKWFGILYAYFFVWFHLV